VSLINDRAASMLAIDRLHAAVVLGEIFDFEDRLHRDGQLAWPP
jgi:hypothetical protein